MNSDPVLDLGDVARNAKPRLLSCLSTPLSVESDLVGVLSLYSTTRASFTDDHRRIVEAISKQVAQAIMSTAPVESGRRAVPTGAVPTTQQIAHLISSKLSAPPDDMPITIAVVSWDAPRQSVGPNEVTVGEVVGAVRNSLRTSDVLFRHSRTELVALLTRTDTTTAHSIADRLLGILGTKGGAVARLNVVVRIASLPTDGSNVDDLVAGAQEFGRSTSDSARSPSVH